MGREFTGTSFVRFSNLTPPPEVYQFVGMFRLFAKKAFEISQKWVHQGLIKNTNKKQTTKLQSFLYLKLEMLPTRMCTKNLKVGQL